MKNKKKILGFASQKIQKVNDLVIGDCLLHLHNTLFYVYLVTCTVSGCMYFKTITMKYCVTNIFHQLKF